MLCAVTMARTTPAKTCRARFLYRCSIGRVLRLQVRLGRRQRCALRHGHRHGPVSGAAQPQSRWAGFDSVAQGSGAVGGAACSGAARTRRRKARPSGHQTQHGGKCFRRFAGGLPAAARLGACGGLPSLQKEPSQTAGRNSRQVTGAVAPTRCGLLQFVNLQAT